MPTVRFVVWLNVSWPLATTLPVMLAPLLIRASLPVAIVPPPQAEVNVVVAASAAGGQARPPAKRPRQAAKSRAANELMDTRQAPRASARKRRIGACPSLCKQNCSTWAGRGATTASIRAATLSPLSVFVCAMLRSSAGHSGQWRFHNRFTVSELQGSPSGRLPGTVSQQVLETLKLARYIAVDGRDPDARVPAMTPTDLSRGGRLAPSPGGSACGQRPRSPRGNQPRSPARRPA